MPVITLDAIADRIRATPPSAGSTVVVAVDGPSGSGKSSLAARLARRLGAAVVHMDDLYPGWDGLAAATITLADQVLRPLADERPARYRRWDWHRDQYAEWVEVPAAPVLIVEGCGSGSTPGAGEVALILWVDASRELRRHRGLTRDGDTFGPYWERWERQEQSLFAAERTRERADLVIDTSAAHDAESEIVTCVR